MPRSRSIKRKAPTPDLSVRQLITELESNNIEIPASANGGVTSGDLIYATQITAPNFGGHSADGAYLKFRLPFPPTVNSLFRNFARGRVKTGRYKNWIKLAYEKFINQVYGQISGRVAIKVLLFRPDQRKRDLDNYLKALLDFLVAQGVIEDDSVVQSIVIAWAKEKKTEGESWVEIKSCQTG